MPLSRQPLHQPARPAKAVEGQLVVIADHEVVPDIEGRERPLTLIQRIDLLAVSGTIVQRLGVGVAGQKFQPGDTLPDTQLQ